MLPALHRSLQRLIYERGNIDQREVEITFEAPTRERIDRLTRPTLCLFLYDIQENLDLRQSNVETTRANGRALRRQASRRFDLHYLVCALTTSLDDEHLLLWRALVTLVRHPQVPSELMEEELRELDPLPVGRIQQEENIQKQFGAWSALNVPPHPAFCYIMSVPVDLDPLGETPLVLKRTTRYSGIQIAQEIREARHQIGGVVRNKQGAPLAGASVSLAGSARECITNGDGQFVLREVPAGTLQLRVSHGRAVQQVFAIEVQDGSSDGKLTDRQFYNVILESDPVSD
jgi:Pvc16 N-terminal domain/Carboxypeptidase regulatory-like domain